MAVTLGVGALAPSPAAAEPSGTVSVTVGPETWVGQPVSITVSGTTSVHGMLRVYSLGGRTPVGPERACPSVKDVEEVALELIGPPEWAPAGSSTSGTYSDHESFTPKSVGTYTFCGYLYEPWLGYGPPPSGTNPVYAAGTGSFNATVQPPPIPPGCTDPACTEPPPPPLPPPPHLTALTVKVRSHTGSTAAKPGHTELLVRATGDAVVLVVLKRQGRTRKTEFSYASSDKLDVPWTCSRPGGVYSFTVTAIHDGDKTLTSRGKFRPVSAARCRALHAADARRRPGEERERAREQREEAAERRHDEREQASEDRGEQARSEYCEHVLGGIPFREVRLDGSKEEVETDCVVGSYTYILRGDPPYIAKVVVRP